jgi:CheY-like chemotaxis protein
VAESKGACVAICRRLRLMGLQVTELPECAVATLPLGPEPFEGATGPLRLDEVRFATVGTDGIKCLTPEPLFHLPILSIRGCSSATDLAARVRRGWAERRAEVARTKAWLDVLGSPTRPLAGGAALEIPLGLDDESACAVAFRPGRVVLPGRGPLSGVVLHRASDRVQHADPACASGTDLAIAITSRLEELARAEGKRERMRAAAARTRRVTRSGERRSHGVLLVGPKVGAERALSESLKLRGHHVHSVRSVPEALGAFREHSFELVLVDAVLNRVEGTELIPALEALPGISHVPILLVDDRLRGQRRKAARRLGAAGYLVRPVSVERIEDGLERLLEAPQERRFSRYPRRLAVRFAGGTRGAHTALIGRGGMGLRCDASPALHELDRFEISLPETRDVVRVDAEVVYEQPLAGRNAGEIGVRFEAFSPGDERPMIAWLSTLEATAS